MGENIFHDASTKVPLIIYDPSPEADVARGSVCDAMVESIDLIPTFVEVAGSKPENHILEVKASFQFYMENGRKPIGIL